jgi:hypothetical protein
MKKKSFNFLQEEEWRQWIGKKVVKISKKPFKSTFLINTVKEITLHPIENTCFYI